MLLVLGVIAVQAVPAKRGVKKTLTLKDGTRVEATLTGDEHVHFYQTADLRAIQQVGDAWQFVNRDSLLRLHRQRSNERNLMRARKVSGVQRAASFQGKRKGLVILVEFSNVKFTYDKAEFNDYFNKTGYDTDGMHGSVRDYFHEQSYGQFDLEFDVVGPITLNTPTNYYADNETRVAAMVNNLCKQVDDEVDFKQYDWDNDGYVDQVYVIYAGYGAAQGAANTIWPHEWSVAGGGTPYTTKEGVTINTYGISCELRGDGKYDTGHIDGIGTSCHEFSHCMGFPDFYDTNGSNFGMDVWSLMDYGCYSDDGRCPAGYTAYERATAGWLELKELNASCQVVDMPAIQDEPVAYIVYNDAHKDEYYLLANHQQKGFDEAARGHGLLVIHVDYNAVNWTYNTVNNTASRQRMTIIPADGSATSGSISGDPFPGTSRNTSLTNTSRPAATLYNENIDGSKLMGKPITEIAEANGLVTFNFMGGAEVASPVSLAPTNVQANGFTANWEGVTGATSYTVCLSKIVQDNPAEMFLLQENFAGFQGLASDLTTDISSQLDDYTVVPGWMGKNLYATNDWLRVGKLGTAGELYSPFVTPKEKGVSIVISVSNAAKFGTTDAQIRLMLPNGGYVYADLQGIDTKPEEGYRLYLLSLEEWAYGTFQVSLFPSSTGSGVYAHYVAVLDGYYTWADLDFLFNQPSLAPVANRAARVDTKQVDWKYVNVPAATESPRRAASVTESFYTAEGTSYTFTNLEPAVYTYRVRATTSDGVSTWSDEVTVDLTTADAIRPLTVAPALTGKTYLPDGRQVNGNNLRPGIYIRDGKRFIVK